MVLASALVTVLIVVGVIVVILVIFLALGPLSRTEQMRDDLDAPSELGGVIPEAEREEAFEDEGPGIVDEGRLDRENE
ncbi:MAG: hypothetical protein ACXVQR_05070 [Solirubrobacteraceae bacterium]